MSKIAERALLIATTQIGVTEVPIGSNAGPMVEVYLHSVGLKKGFAWCMSFVYWCVDHAAAQTALVNPLQKTGGVLAQYNKSKGLVTLNPAPGDIFIMDFGKGVGHTGFVEKVTGNIIHTIEGNTNDDGSREGYEVCRRQRPITTIKAFLRT